MAGKEKFVKKIVEKFNAIDSKYVESYLTRVTHDKNFLEELLNILDEGVLVLDENKNIIIVNSVALKMLNINNDIVSGKPIAKYLADDRLRIFFDKVWDYNDKSMNTEITLEYPNKIVLGVSIINFTNYKISATDDTFVKVFVFTDITSRINEMEELLKTEKLNTFNMLSAGVAHEIGNPLNSLDIHMQLLKNTIESIDSPQKKELLDMIDISRDELNRLDNIIKRFLKSVRPFKLNLSEGSITNTIEGVLEVMLPEIKSAGIETKLVFDDKLPAFLFDHDQIKQAANNIIKNAIQAMPYGGKLTIEVCAQKEYCKVSISDTGKGIKKTIIKDIFDPYFTTKQEGTGLGLMIVSKIISAHEGDISVISEENKGTIIIIKLPMKRKSGKFLPEKPDII